MTAGPSLEDIKAWPATVSVDEAASALGVSRSWLYEQVKTDAVPLRVIRVGSRVRIATASILVLLAGEEVLAA